MSSALGSLVANYGSMSESESDEEPEGEFTTILNQLQNTMCDLGGTPRQVPVHQDYIMCIVQAQLIQSYTELLQKQKVVHGRPLLF